MITARGHFAPSQWGHFGLTFTAANDVDTSGFHGAMLNLGYAQSARALTGTYPAKTESRE
jgi:hypothetical protein